MRDLEEKKKKFEEKYISPKDKLLLLDDNGNLPQNLASGLSPSLAITFSMKSNEQQAIIDETNKKLEDWVINSNNRIKNKRKRDDNIGIEEENEDNDKNSSKFLLFLQTTLKKFAQKTYFFPNKGEKPLKNRKTLQNKHKKLTTSNAILFDFETIETAVEKGGLADEMSTHSSNFATKPGERMTLNAFLFRTQIAAISKTFDDSKTIFPDNSSELSKLTHPTKADLTITKVTKVFPDIRSSFSEFSKNSKENSKISARLLFSHFKSDPIPISKYPPNEKGVAFKDLDYSTQVQFKKKLISDPQNQYIFRDSILFESNRFNELVNSANNANNMNEGINQESNQEPIKNILFCSPKKLWNNRKSVPSQSGALEEYELVKNLQMTADEEIDKDKELLVSWEKFSNKSSVDVITWKAIDERIELNRAPIPIKESINAKILIQNE